MLAFATDEGRIGIFDTNSKKAPILCRQYYRHTVYSVGWGPAPNINGYALYSCGDNEIVYYNPDKYNESNKKYLLFFIEFFLRTFLYY